MDPWFAPSGWLIRAALGGGLILLLTWCLVRMARQPARQQHLGIWGAVAALVVACGCTISPWLRIPLLTEPTVAHALAADRAADAPAEWVEAEVWLVNDSMPLRPPAAESQPNDLAQPSAAAESFPLRALAQAAGRRILSWLPWLYLSGVGFFIVRWLLAQHALVRVARKARPARARLQRLLRSMLPAGLPMPRLLIADGLSSPAAWGVIRPTILIPAHYEGRFNESALRCIFAHELTHIERTDAWTCLLFNAAQALYFFCPWFWSLRRRVRLCQEYIADARAVCQAPSPEDYAQFLLSFTTSQAAPRNAFGVIGRRSDLFRRVSMLLEERLSVETRCPRRWSLTTAAALLSIAVVTSGLGLASSAGPDDEQIPKPPAPPQLAEASLPPAPPQLSDEALPPVPPMPPLAGAVPPVPPMNSVVAQADDDSPSAREYRKAQEAWKAAQKKWTEHAKESVKDEDKLKEGTYRYVIVNEGDSKEGAESGQIGKRVKVLVRTNSAERGRLGISYENPSAALADQLGLNEGRGIVISQVIPDSPAAKSGLKANDVLVELDGKPVPQDPSELHKLIAGIKANKEIDAIVIRKGKKETIGGIKLGEAKPAGDHAWSEDVQHRFRVMAVPGFPGDMKKLDGLKVEGLKMEGLNLKGMEGFGNAWAMHSDRGVTITINKDGDRFTARRQQGNLTVTVTGSVSDGKGKVAKIKVKDGKTTNEYDSVEDVPERFRDHVKHLVNLTQKDGAKIDDESP